jgi:transcriptional regulator with XRE-family HTH domain
MESNLSLFLKSIRHLNNKEKLSDMARRLNVSSSYLSTVENGKRAMNDKLFNAIIVEYRLSPNDIRELDMMRKLESNQINVNTEELNKEKKEVLVKFLSNIDDLSDDEITKINKLMNKKK